MRANAAEMFRGRRIVSSRGIEQTKEALTNVFLPVDFPAARASTPVAMELNALRVGRVTCGYMRFQNAVQIETAEGKQAYATAQRSFAERAAPLRKRLIAECDRLLAAISS